MSSNKVGIIISIAICLVVVIFLGMAFNSIHRSLEIGEKIELANEENRTVYREYFDFGIDAGVLLDIYLNKSSDGDAFSELKTMVQFRQNIIKNLELKRYTETQKKGLIDGIDFVWNKRLKDKSLEEVRERIKEMSKSVIADMNNLPVQ
jgi:hypothetical protein